MTQEETRRKTKQREMSGVQKEFRKQNCCETVKTSRDSSEGVLAMMIWSEVEMENGHWCMRLVNESQNHNEMTERSGDGAEVWKLVKDISRCFVCNRGYGEGRAHDESRANGNAGETKC